MDVVDRHGQLYRIQRILNDPPCVYAGGKLLPGVAIRESILGNPLFFGQKELATAGDGSQAALIEKLLGTKCNEARARINEQKGIVENLIARLAKAMLKTLGKNSGLRAELEATLHVELSKLNDAWREEFLLIKRELDKVTLKNKALDFNGKRWVGRYPTQQRKRS